jgi:FMN phosphatase YigB (HAD superfamily)
VPAKPRRSPRKATEKNAMIRALLLDLGNTLIGPDLIAFPGVKEALSALEKLQTQDHHKPLVMCLVSDHPTPMPDPITPAAVDTAFEEYLGILEGAGLRKFFEPVEERVTLSIHAGAKKPAAVVFETALKRARIDGPITDTLFITEDAGHVDACRKKLHMTALQFGEDFKAWSAAPMLIAQLVGAPGAPE